MIRTQLINSEKQWVFLIITVDGNECQFTHVAPADLTGQALEDYITANMDFYKLEVLRNMYPEAPHAVYNGDLATFEQWIADGCLKEIKSRDAEGNEVVDTVQVQKIPFQGTHPKEERIIDGMKIGTTTLAQLDSASTVDELRIAIRDILIGRN